MSIHVHLERFEGPLGLLLHLIREQEMDIFNINIHQITRQYLEYIKAMRRLDLEVAGEFVAMAATLLHIKSKMLLPNYTEEGEEAESLDPRKELVQKLLEYKKFQELSADLYKRPLLGRDVFARGAREDVEALEDGELVLDEKPLFSLIAAYRFALKNMKKTVHKVLGELQSIGARIMEMKDLLIVGRRVMFGELITERGTGSNQVLVTFLSLLELAKMGFVSIFQTETLSDIHIHPKKVIDRDVISQVENYESVNAEAAAEKIMSEATQLSLDEGVIPSADDLADGEVIVQEASGDAASDEDIEAEERRLFAADLSPAEASEPIAAIETADSTDVTIADAPLTDTDIANATTEQRDMGAPVAERREPFMLADLSFLTAPEEVPATAAPPVGESVDAAIADAPEPANVETPIATFSDTDLLAAPVVESNEPQIERPEAAVLRAVSSALAAFDALSDTPSAETPTADSLNMIAAAPNNSELDEPVNATSDTQPRDPEVET